ncbi:unnamed protein product, partial [Arctogadus glacialis]
GVALPFHRREIPIDGDLVLGGPVPVAREGVRVLAAPTLLPGVSLGVHILDTAPYPTLWSRGGRTKTKLLTALGRQATSPPWPSPVIRAHEKRVHYSAKLSDKSLATTTFARTVPPDFYQAKAMAEILAHLQLDYVPPWRRRRLRRDGHRGFEQEARMRNSASPPSEK